MKLKLGLLLALLTLLGVVSAPVVTHAASNMRSGTVATVAKDETVDASAYLAGSTVTMAGTVHGDLFCAGQNVDITGTVEGDVFCAGQTLHVSGTVLGSVHVAGQTVTLSGPVGHSLTAFGQSVTVESDAVVNLDATIFGSALQLDGKVTRDAVLGGQDVTLMAAIGRNVTATSEHLTLASGDKIGGNLEYTSRNQVQVDNGAAIAGSTTRHEPAMHQRADRSWAAGLGVLYWFGAALFFGLILLGLAPRTFVNIQRLQLWQSGWSLLAGLITLVMVPIIAVLLMVTVIGVPVGFALLLLWLVALFASYVYSAYTIGAWVAEQAKWKLLWARALALLLGTVILALLMLIPVAGGLFGLLALVWGMGGITLAFGAYIREGNRPASTKVAAKRA